MQTNKKKSPACRQAGFTLIEIIIAVVLAGIIYSIFAVVINSGISSWFFIRDQKTMMADTRAVIKRMAREIRLTKDATAANILTFTATQYQFNDISNNVINYQKSGTNLLRNGVVMLNNLDNASGLQFAYLDAHGATTSTVTAIRTVQISLITRSGSNRIRLQSAAGIRNL